MKDYNRTCKIEIPEATILFVMLKVVNQKKKSKISFYSAAKAD